MIAVGLVCAGFGVLSAYMLGGGRGVGPSAAVGGLIGVALSASEIQFQDRLSALFHAVPVAAAFAFRVVYYAVVILAAGAVVNLLFDLPPERAVSFSARNVVFSAGVAVLLNLYFMLQRLLGPAMLESLLSGRYHRPRREERVVMFLDLSGSTQLAERLGDEAFHRFLNRVFFDLTNPIYEAGGDIYRYVGDEIIVTWPAARGVRNGACVSCLFAVLDRLAARRAAYERDFGAAPQMRAALHVGPLIVGEMGDIKREIVMLGDTMNTTSRIEDACRKMGRDCLASAELMARIGPPPPDVAVEALGEVELRGKAARLALVALSRA